MKGLVKYSNNIWDRLCNKGFFLAKGFYQVLKTKSDNKIILFIVGFQRAGTTMITEIFNRDFNAKVYKETSELSSEDPQKIRLNSLDSVKTAIDRQMVPLVVLKPLVESQNTIKLLNYFESSKALWVYRHYKDVASSHFKAFSNESRLDNLRTIVDRDSISWISENASEFTRNVISKYFSEDMNQYDAAALFWFARNRLFFEQDLHKHIQVMMCKYEDLVINPYEVTKKIYKFIDLDYPGKKIIGKVHSASINKGRGIELSKEVERLCEELYEQLEEVYYLQKM